MPAPADLLGEGLAIADVVARRLSRRLGDRVDLDDLRSMARFALVDVMRSFDPTRASFAAYATSRLKWSVLDEVRRQTHGRVVAARVTAVMASERLLDVPPPDEGSEPRTPEAWSGKLSSFLDDQAAALAVGLATSAVDVFARGEGPVDPEEQTARAELAAQVRRAVGALPERERTLLERHYFAGEPFDVVARELGISKSWASRLHDRAIAAMGEVLRRGA